MTAILEELHSFLKRCGVLHDGNRFELEWKAERPTKEAPLRWELRRILPTVNYDITQTQTVANRIRDQRKAWATCWASLDFSEASKSLWGPSVRMLPPTPSEKNLERASSTAWLSTVGLLCLLLHWQACRTDRTDAAVTAGVAQCLLTWTVAKEVLAQIMELDASEQMLGRCEQEPRVDGACACVNSLRHFRSAMSQREALPSRAFQVLQRLYVDRACGTCRGLLHDFIVTMANHIDDNADRWGKADLSKLSEIHLMGPSGEKRRRIDGGFKEMVVADAITIGRAHSGGGMLKSLEGGDKKGIAQRWEHNLVRAHQAASWIAFRNLGVCHQCYDGTRLGNPGREDFDIIVFCPSLCIATVLPPQVRRT